jgi:hypothetical protein
MSTEVIIMQIASVREFRDRATKMFRSQEAILVTNHGHVAGFYFPYPAQTLPLDIKRDLLKKIVHTIGTKIKQPTIKQENRIISDFLASRKNRR